jgi:head-tail adaptor
MRFGPNSARLRVLRRALDATDMRGDFVEAFATWCGWRVASPRQLVEAGLAEDVTTIVARVHNTLRNRSITLADRARLAGAEYAVVSVSPPDRAGGFIEIALAQRIGG